MGIAIHSLPGTTTDPKILMPAQDGRDHHHPQARHGTQRWNEMWPHPENDIEYVVSQSNDDRAQAPSTLGVHGSREKKYFLPSQHGVDER